MAARPGPESPPLPLPPMCTFIVSAQGAINTPWTMKCGFLHQGKDFSVRSLYPRRKGRFESVCRHHSPGSHLTSGPQQSPCTSSQILSLTIPAHVFTPTSPPYPLVRATLVHAGRWAMPGAAPGSSEPLQVPAAQLPARQGQHSQS